MDYSNQSLACRVANLAVTAFTPEGAIRSSGESRNIFVEIDGCDIIAGENFFTSKSGGRGIGIFKGVARISDCRVSFAADCGIWLDFRYTFGDYNVLRRGQSVAISNVVSRPELNGQRARSLGSPESSQRCPVQLSSGEKISLKVSCLEPIDELGSERTDIRSRDCAEPWPRHHVLEHNELFECSAGYEDGTSKGEEPAIVLHYAATAALSRNVVRNNFGAAVGRSKKGKEEQRSQGSVEFIGNVFCDNNGYVGPQPEEMSNRPVPRFFDRDIDGEQLLTNLLNNMRNIML
jgi:hypothetical protein